MIKNNIRFFKRTKGKITIQRRKEMKAFWTAVHAFWLLEEQKEQRVSFGSVQKVHRSSEPGQT